jgi:hypothetical protein
LRRTDCNCRRILVPMNGSILLYDGAIAMTSGRLQIIYDSGGLRYGRVVQVYAFSN